MTIPPPTRLAVLFGAVLLCLLVLAGRTPPAHAVTTGVTPTADPSGPWRWPLDGPVRVTRGFDPPDTPYGRGHRGVDLAGRPGQVVRAAGPGRVGYSGLLAGRGVVSVRHAGGLRTTYEPVQPSVHRGDPVAAGAVLGRLVAGHRGCPAAACLHWGLLRGDTYLDPLALLGATRVRLLPLGLGAPNPDAPHRTRRSTTSSDPDGTGADGRDGHRRRAPPTTAVLVGAGLAATGGAGAAGVGVIRRRQFPPGRP